MFENAGSKVKTLAIVSFTLTVILSAIGGILTITTGGGFAGIVIIFCGILSAWISSVVLYAIGETAEKCEYMSEALAELRLNTPRAEEESVMRSSPKAVIKKASGHTPTGWICTCGAEHPAYVSSCGCGVNKRDIK